MRSIKFLIVALMSASLFASCNKEAGASLSLERTSLYFSSWDDPTPQTIKYVSSNAVSVAVGSCSDGWSAYVDASTKTIVVRAVGSTSEDITDDELLKEGSVVVNALNKENKATSYYISVYISEMQAADIDGAANCYIITRPAVNYTFDVMYRPDGTPLDTESVKLLWQSNSDVVKNVHKSGDKASFYIAPSEVDNSQVVDTNAVIAAYNKAGEVIWSWHLWIVNDNPLTVTDTYSNGKTFMRYNLGAFTNANGDASTDKILASYGLYYQWGRKDPFPRPYFHDAAGAESESRYKENGTYITDEFLARTASNGVVEYAIQNPMQYIYNDENSEYAGDSGNGIGDWLVSANNALWSDSEKSVYDPCPKGWRVPTADDLKVLKLSDDEDSTPLETARKQFGWHLSDGNNEFFYSACGRRRYNDGKVENMNYKDGVYPSTPEPWEGHYWTSSTTTDGQAVSLYFDLTTTRTINRFVVNQPRFRANGFQVRCVKE